MKPNPAQLESPPSSRGAVLFAGVSLIAALAWLISRVWLGLDFADEMQYYGEISSLVRTGRFFEDDLFLQQLGYVFVLPFFKLHALFFPDQTYLILFGRLLLAAAYAVVGRMFWRAATKLEFAPAQKTAGLAVFFSWVPFQIFAFSYNTSSYLLIVAVVACWITRDPVGGWRHVVRTAGLLAMLTYTHPSAGLVLIAAAVAEAAWRAGWRAAWTLAAAAAGSGLAVLGVMIASHGSRFPTDLLDAINFTRSFGLGQVIQAPDHTAGGLILLFTCCLFLARILSGRTLKYPLSIAVPTAIRWVLLTGLVLGMSALFGLVANWKTGWLAFCGGLFLLMLLAVSVEPADGRRPALKAGDPPLWRWAMLISLGAGLAGLFAVLLPSPYCLTGHFAIALFVVLLAILAVSAGQPDRQTLAGLVVIGSITGTVFGFTSGNGLHNFGVGAAGVLPFLALFASRQLQTAEGARTFTATGAVVPMLSLLLLLNGVLNPYREQLAWKPFLPFKSVPAFQGIWSSALKMQAVEIFQQAFPPGALQGKRVLITGGHPWLYFVVGGQPATSMLFMKFDGKPQAYELAAERLFRHGEPDVIILADPHLAAPIAAQVIAWGERDNVVRIIPLPMPFRREFLRHTACWFAPEAITFTRAPRRP